MFQGISISGSNIQLSHLFYADDALFIGEWSHQNIKNLARLLKCFYVSSGLSVNYRKSKVFGIGVNSQEVENWALPLGCEPSTLPFTFLGIPVGENMNRKSSWNLIIENFRNKLSCWKSKSLSFGGRMNLAKPVLGNLPTFYLSLFAAPLGVIETLEKIRRNFIWGGTNNEHKIRWVTWDTILAPKEAGGLGMGSIKAMNLALLAKWKWKFFSRAKLDMDSDIIRRNQEESRWEFDFAIDGKFHVAGLRGTIDRAGHLAPDGAFTWSKWIPNKVNRFVWRARIDRIPSASALMRRGVNIQGETCSVCISGSETADHMLVTCPFAIAIWNRIWNWCEIILPQLSNVKGILNFVATCGKS
ncbi:unnamed protein product [Lactuca saligna]|uniref:Reverse transcriptase domain-containing protein n=1 Tax=Lactuca saligna TaxID=75948 RepID=A0AA35Y5T2_LACSI|nr:unnamed protein product [Lactuca saligna]